jgi:hypothetical protein
MGLVVFDQVHLRVRDLQTAKAFYEPGPRADDAAYVLDPDGTNVEAVPRELTQRGAMPTAPTSRRCLAS